LLSLIGGILVDALPATIPMKTQVFWYFSPEELEQNFESRLVISLKQGHTMYSQPFALNPSTPYLHIEGNEMQVFSADEHRIGIEWRRQTDTNDAPWNRESVFWPIFVHLSS